MATTRRKGAIYEGTRIPSPTPTVLRVPEGLRRSSDILEVNFGPNHPSTHGVLRLVVQLNGESVVGLEAVIGYLHTGFEKSMEQKTWWKAIPYAPRMDYLGWGDESVAGYWGNAYGRDLNIPGTAALKRTPEPKPKRFAVNYHLLAVADEPRRVRVQAWLDDGEEIASVVSVWPTADWHEREAWDMMGIAFDGHPNMVRILMDDDWEGHPLRKDYPIGGEPVRFSEAE